MSNKAAINTQKAPAAIGPYSQAIKAGNTVYMSGQIPLDPATMTLVEGDVEAQARQVFNNLKAVCEEAAGSLSDIVKLNLYLVELEHFSVVNGVMEEFFTAPYPARAAVGVKALPKGSQVEAEAVMVIGD